MKSWEEEFNKRYKAPQVDEVTVGFSGIDPQVKTVNDADIGEEVWKRLKELEIRIDSGNIEPDKPEPEPDPYPLVPVVTDHEKLDGLLGGNENGHYHLTADERLKLQNMPATGVKGEKGDKGDKGDPGPKGDKVDPGTVEGLTGNHEELSGLLGGAEDEHYHLTEEEQLRLAILIRGFFPTGTDQIYIPYVDASDPDNPIVLPYTPFVDLPKGTPPEWEIRNATSNNTPLSNITKNAVMYSGKALGLSDGLFVFGQATTTNSVAYYTSDLINWQKPLNSFSSLVSGVYNTGGGYIDDTQEFELLFLNNTNTSELYYLTNQSEIKKASAIWGKDGSTAIKTKIVSATVSPELGILLLGNTTNFVTKKIKGVSGFTRYTVPKPSSVNAIYLNNNGLAWSPDAQVFCACGKYATSTSADGENWITHSDAQRNLTDLTYREDLESFFARCLDDKLFYASGDGITWKAVTSTPIPLETVSCVDFCAETGIYCAVGGTGRYAYFSKDLSTWVATTITNGTPIEAGSVIYMPSTKKYVLMPTSGSYYYTFDASEWVN